MQLDLQSIVSGDLSTISAFSARAELPPPLEQISELHQICRASLMEHQFLDPFAVAQVVVDDAVHVLGRHVVVPRAVRLHADDGAALAGGKTPHPAALDAQLAGIQSRSLELAAQAIEQRLRRAIFAATRTGADQQVAVIVADLRLDDFTHASLSSPATASASTGSFKVSRM